MRKLFLFMMVSLDGYFEGPNHDLTWHTVDSEFVRFAIEQTNTVGTILFGRRTYEMMASYWPTDEAVRTDPGTARLMNETPKIVFSHSLKEVAWQNSRLAMRPLPEEVRALKAEPGKDMAVFGSNSLSVELIRAGLLDELRIMVNPKIIGRGTPLLAGLNDSIVLTLADTRIFNSGNVLLRYQIDY